MERVEREPTTGRHLIAGSLLGLGAGGAATVALIRPWQPIERGAWLLCTALLLLATWGVLRGIGRMRASIRRSMLMLFALLFALLFARGSAFSTGSAGPTDTTPLDRLQAFGPIMLWSLTIAMLLWPPRTAPPAEPEPPQPARAGKRRKRRRKKR